MSAVDRFITKCGERPQPLRFLYKEAFITVANPLSSVAMPLKESRTSLDHARHPSSATLIEGSNDGGGPTKGSRRRPPFRYQPSVDEKAGYQEVTPLPEAPGTGTKAVEDEPPATHGKTNGWYHRIPEPIRWPFTAPRPLVWLFLNALLAFLWGVVLAVFCGGKVPWDWSIYQFLKQYDREWTHEIIALVGSLCKLHVTYVLQTALELYSHVVIAGDFTLKDLKWMQGVNEETIFTEFPDRPGAPARSDKQHGVWGRVKGLGWSIYRFCSNLRLAWVVIWLGLLLHNSAIVSILQPVEFWEHTQYDDPVPCGIDASALTLDTERFLTDDEQQALDKMSYEVGLQLGNYVDQVSANTTTAVSGRKYRKDSFAYGAIGGLNEGLQDIPGVQYNARCTTNASEANSTWSFALPGVVPPTVAAGWTGFINLPTLPSTFRSIESHSTPTFTLSLFESAMYGAVDPLGNGAFITLSLGASNLPPAPLICSWTTAPKLVHIEMVNFTALVLSHEPANVYPSLSGRATWATMIGMATASRLGANIHPDALGHFRHTVTLEAGPSYSLNAVTTAQVVEIILADGGKTSMTKYSPLAVRHTNTTQSGAQMAFCNSTNRTVREHWRFGNSKKIGWIAVFWTIGMGILGMSSAVWMSKKRMVDGVSPLGAAGGFVLAIGENIPDDQPLVVKDGKVNYKAEEEGAVVESLESPVGP